MLAGGDASDPSRRYYYHYARRCKKGALLAMPVPAGNLARGDGARAVEESFSGCGLEPALPQARLEEDPYQEWSFPDGTPWTAFYRVEGGYLLRFPKLADFVVSADGRHATCHPVPGVSETTWRHIYLNQVRPLMLGRQGKLVFHASAVDLGDFAIAFAAQSGRGKSTLAAAFATAGCRFLTDDGLVIEPLERGYSVIPDHPSIRLREDSREALAGPDFEAAPTAFSTKKRLPAQARLPYCAEPRAFRATYFLGDGSATDTKFRPLDGGEALSRWLEHSFLLDGEDRQMLAKQFEGIADLATRIPCFELDYPRRFDQLELLRASITAHATSLGDSA